MILELRRMIVELRLYVALSLAMTVFIAGMVFWRPGADAQLVLLLTPFLILAALARSNIKLARRMEKLEQQFRASGSDSAVGGVGG